MNVKPDYIDWLLNNTTDDYLIKVIELVTGQKILSEEEQEANYFTSPAFDGSSEAREQVGNIIVQAFKGSKDINTIFADAVANCRG